jgi:hypothetical protein
MDLPLCVSECPDMELRHMAISAFARGTDADRHTYMTKCLTLQMAAQKKDDKKLRRAKYDEWLSYIQDNAVINQTENGNPTGPTDLGANFGAILDDKTLDSAGEDHVPSARFSR